MSDTIREFVVGLGYKLDESSQRNFVGALEGATLRAKLLGDVIEGMARTVVDKVGEVAESFENLFYQSQRVGASENSIRAFGYAIQQVGGHLENANASLVGFGDFLAKTPGAAAGIANQLNIPLKDTADKGKFLLEIYEQLAKKDRAFADPFRQAYHLGDDDTFLAGRRHDAQGFYDDKLKRDAASGVNHGAMKSAVEFEQTWRGVWDRIGTMAEGGESKLFAALTEPMQKFSEWLDNNSGKINDAISKMATSVGALTTAWVEDLSKVNWADVATDFDNTAKSIAGFVGEMTGLVKTLVDFNEKSKDWWFTKLINGVAGGNLGSLPSGPGFVASHGPGIGADEAASGIGGWLKSHAPSWLGGGSGSEGPLSQNGAPISESNPLAVNIVRADAGSSGGGGWLSSMMGAIFGGSGEGGGGHGASATIRARGGYTSGKGPYNYENSPGSGELTKLITAEAQRAGIDPRIMEGIRAGESGHGSKYDIKDDAQESSWGPFQLNRRRGLGVAFEKDTGLNVRDPKTIAAQARWVANYIKQHGGPNGQWMGFHGARDADPKWGDSGYSPDKPAAGAPTGSLRPAPKIGAPIAWDQGKIWNGLNAALPVGGSNTTDASKSVTSTVTNNITVSGSDPQSTAAMVGLHLDRTANDIGRTLQGAH